jgi:cytoplasmic iron level regulating protein YaaA (DUF328/UPF0246 family)
MIVVISPAKKIIPENNSFGIKTTEFLFQRETKEILNVTKSMTISELQSLMGISDNLAKLNHERYQDFDIEHGENKVVQAIFTFRGDTYVGLNADKFTKDDITFAQKNLRILSGLYGILRPLDGMQPYRLEMGTKIGINGKTDLYDFWTESVTNKLKKELETNNKNLINLASEEYFKVIDQSKLKSKVITPIFKTNKNGNLKTIGILSKRARGMMANFIIKNRIESPQYLKDFSNDGYSFQEKLSSENKLIFTR